MRYPQLKAHLRLFLKCFMDRERPHVVKWNLEGHAGHTRELVRDTECDSQLTWITAFVFMCTFTNNKDDTKQKKTTLYVQCTPNLQFCSAWTQKKKTNGRGRFRCLETEI